MCFQLLTLHDSKAPDSCLLHRFLHPRLYVLDIGNAFRVGIVCVCVGGRGECEGAPQSSVRALASSFLFSDPQFPYFLLQASKALSLNPILEFQNHVIILELFCLMCFFRSTFACCFVIITYICKYLTAFSAHTCPFVTC